MTFNTLPRPLIIFILILSATLFASNHIAARFAFDNGAGLILAILARGLMSLLFMLAIVFINKSSLFIPPHLRKWQVALGLLIAFQSLFLYSAITLIPVPMALLLVNTWPMMFILASWLLGRSQPKLPVLLMLALILVGLFLVLDIDTSIELETSWLLGVFFAWFSAVLLAATMWITQYYLAELPGSVRSTYTMMGVLAVVIIVGVLNVVPNGLSLPHNTTGWYGLLSLSIFYGIAITLLFVLAHKLDMARNSPILNFEPVASIFLAYGFLGQVLNSMQLLGGAIVVLGIVSIGFMK